MEYEEFKNRLKKCSFESICMYLYDNGFKDESMLRNIELLEFDIKSKEYLSQTEELLKKINALDISDPLQYIEYTGLSKERKKVQDNLHRLNDEWFTNITKSEVSK